VAELSDTLAMLRCKQVQYKQAKTPAAIFAAGTAFRCAVCEHADALLDAAEERDRLRNAARWLAENPKGTPVPEWVDVAVNGKGGLSHGSGGEIGVE
jgi:hypothetical protein